MNTQQLTTLDQITCFLEGTEPLTLAFSSQQGAYAWIQRTLKQFRYKQLRQSK